MMYSVLMSVWKNDNPEFLRLALKSIYEDQEKKPDEIVVVFDGPLTDELYAVLDAFRSDKEEVVKYLKREHNMGLGAALSIGLAECSGDYIFRMDADDISLPERFKMQSEYIEAHPEIDVLGSFTREFEYSTDEDMRLVPLPTSHEDIVSLAKTRNPINHMSVCMRREAVLACGGYKTLLLLEDYYLWLRMMVAGYRFATLPTPLVNVRIGNGFYKRRSASVQIRGWRVLQDYMVENKMIGKLARFKNMLIVRTFVLIPSWLKKWVYSTFMRKKDKK